jgi:hypothetical protein
MMPPSQTLETKEQVEVRLLQGRALSEQERTIARCFYAPAFFLLSCFWLLIVTVLLYLNGFSIVHVSDSVLIAVVTTTTANIIGTLLVVAKYLFPNEK